MNSQSDFIYSDGGGGCDKKQGCLDFCTENIGQDGASAWDFSFRQGEKGGITLGEGKSQSLVSESRIGPSLAVLIQANVLTFLRLSFLPCGWSWNSNDC